MNFGSDNQYGVDPRILQAMADANTALTAPSYCHDNGARAVDERLSEIFEKDVKAFLVVNGTGANALSLSTICPPHGGVLCHEDSHVFTDECNCPELLTGGAKMIGLAGRGGKLPPSALRQALAKYSRGEHSPKLSAVSITNATEFGTVYTPQEILALSAVAQPAGLRLHMDGARFANALVSLGCTPAEMTWKSGIDVLSFGGTKNGAMLLEAVVFFDTTLADQFLYLRKRAGQLVSKGRYLSAQMLTYLKDDVWLPNARRANELARDLADGMARAGGLTVAQPVEANEVFVTMPRSLLDALRAKGASFYEWPLDGLAENGVHCRFVTSFATPRAHVDQFLSVLREVTN